MDKIEIKTKSSKNYITAVGRRREAVARVRIYTAAGKIEVFGEERKRGDIVINKKPVMEYFSFASSASKYKKLLGETGVDGKYVISARITGKGDVGARAQEPHPLRA
jgi:ribosomal protein S9